MKVKTRLFPLTLTALLIFCMMLSGCAEQLRNKQLEKVAKDWALVIRASQLIPVYPLSEDLQPGDILLVSTPIEDQVKIYKKRGFLPLDQHMVRLMVGYNQEYSDFYRQKFGIPYNPIPPETWWGNTPSNGKWELAPHAAFPSYNFSVESGAGLNLALPIEGVPVALGFMNSGKASGSVTIDEAYTYGLDMATMVKLVKDWGKANRDLLRPYHPVECSRPCCKTKYHFLRVISRVYLTGHVSVTVKNDDATSAEVAAGADRPVNLMGVKEGDTGENFSKAVSALQLLSSNIPGGRVKFTAATSRSVSLDETFAKPLVIGYVGFDIPILEGGKLGAPISTLSQLNGTTIIESASSESNNIYRYAAISFVYTILTNEKDSKTALAIKAKLDKIAGSLPNAYPFTTYLKNKDGKFEVANNLTAGSTVDKSRGFQAVLDYFGNADNTVRVLEGQFAADKEPGLFKDLQEAKKALVQVDEILSQNQGVLLEASDFALLGAGK